MKILVLTNLYPPHHAGTYDLRCQAITDALRLRGHTTLIAGQGKLKVGVGPVRTGVTAVLPRGKGSSDPVFGDTGSSRSG